MTKYTIIGLAVASILLFRASAAESLTEIPRRIPPKGIEIPAHELEELESGLNSALREFSHVRKDPLSADAEVFLKAVRFALDHGEFYGKGDPAKAKRMLEAGKQRIIELKQGKAPWTTQRGLVVRGYRSKIDGSVQPYGLEIPEDLDLSKPVPLFVWLHGRGDKVTDLHFMAQRMEKSGEYKFPQGIVVHPFGRQCIGWKSAGEIDVLDVVDEVNRHYGIDQRRIALMGFSMGGAGAWHIGSHYDGKWALVHAGAGFAETARYTNLKPENYPSEIEQKMWRIYDVPCYARNLLNVPLIAYSGEEDKQIQAALVMEEALASHGTKLKHVIGKGMGHKYDDSSRTLITEFASTAVANGLQTGLYPVNVQTRTLRYPGQRWLQITGMEIPYEDTTAEGIEKDGVISIKTKNATALKVGIPASKTGYSIEVDGDSVSRLATGPVNLVKTDGKWRIGTLPEGVKRPGLQGPIDDAFMAPFLVVLPDTDPDNPLFSNWLKFETGHLSDRWRSLFRGHVRIKKASEVTDGDIAEFHLIVFGDSDCNSILKRAMAQGQLGEMLVWKDGQLTLNGKDFDASNQIPLLIHPNPLNPDKYIVVNSGPTFREDHDRTNSLQNPKLGDWAIIDLRTPPDGTAAGKVVDCGIFNSHWK